MKMSPCTCTHCGASNEAPPHYTGRRMRCMACQKDFLVVPDSLMPPPYDESPEASEEGAARATETGTRSRTRWGLASFCGLVLFGAASAAVLWFHEVEQRKVLEEGLASNLAISTALRKELRALEEKPDPFAVIQEDLNQLNEAFISTTSDYRRQGSSILRSELSIQYAQKVILRQQDELGKMALRLSLLEREVADKDRQAAAELDLAIKRRKEADERAKPIRSRIRELEEQKEALFVRYRAISTPQLPTSVVSTRRAAEMVKDWDSRRAPLLKHLEEEIGNVRFSIEVEEGKLDALYQPVAD